MILSSTAHMNKLRLRKSIFHHLTLMEIQYSIKVFKVGHKAGRRNLMKVLGKGISRLILINCMTMNMDKNQEIMKKKINQKQRKRGHLFTISSLIGKKDNH